MYESSCSPDLLAHIPSRRAVCERLQQPDEHLVVYISRWHLHVFLVSSSQSVFSAHVSLALNFAAQKALESPPSAPTAAATAVPAGFATAAADAFATSDLLDAAPDALEKLKPDFSSTSKTVRKIARASATDLGLCPEVSGYSRGPSHTSRCP